MYFKFSIHTLLICVVFFGAAVCRPQSGNWFGQTQGFPQQSLPQGFENLFINIPPQQQQQQQPQLPQLPPAQELRTTTSTPTTASPQYISCLRTCPSTTEYNPICGSDGEDYHNNGRLQCAVNCGRAVSAVRMGTCEPV